MSIRDKAIRPDVLNVLQESTVTEDGVALPPRLERKLYQEVNDVLERLGGKWNKRRQMHIFPENPVPLIAGVLSSEKAPPKNPLQFYATPPEIVRDFLLGWGVLFPHRMYDEFAGKFRILEPSAGHGAILRGIFEALELNFMIMSPPHDQVVCVDAVEINEERVLSLHAQGYGRTDYAVFTQVFQMDFLTFDPGYLYNRIYMNPPFVSASDSLAYIAHVKHAYDMLAPEGELFAVVPSSIGFRTDKRTTALRTLVEMCGQIVGLPDDAFKESGTEISSVMICLSRGK